MDTEAYLLTRRQIQDRLAAHRAPPFPERNVHGSSAEPFSWWPVVGRWLMGDAGWPKLISGIATAGAGYALSRLARRLSLNRLHLNLWRT